jgi:nicotinamide riboside transporter PnuC
MSEIKYYVWKSYSKHKKKQIDNVSIQKKTAVTKTHFTLLSLSKVTGLQFARAVALYRSRAQQPGEQSH